MTSVPLPHVPRTSNPGERGVWEVTVDVTMSDGSSTHGNVMQDPLDDSLGIKCDRIARGNCCKDLKDEERHLINPDIMRDIVIGLSDGLTVPFALTAGLSSLGESRIVVFGGVAELIAGCISMGVGGFLATQSERDHFRYLRKRTAARVERSCDGEMEREVHEILGPIGIHEKLSHEMAQCLLKLETEADVSNSVGGPEKRIGDAESSGLRQNKDAGMTGFLLKFGAGVDEIPAYRPYASAFTIGMGYLIGGLIPLLPYFFIRHVGTALMWSAIATGIALLVFGVIKTRVTGGMGGWFGYVYGALTTLAVGGAAAVAAYFIVAALERHK